MDPGKLAKLQAQAASNRIGTSISATSGPRIRGLRLRLRLCVCCLADATPTRVQVGRAQYGER